MRLIDADRLKEKVLEWLPSDPCGIEEKEHPIETDIVVSLMMEIEEAPTVSEWIPVSDIRKLEDVVYMHIDSLEGTRNIVEAGMLSAWKEVAEYVDGMLGEDGDSE